MVIKNLHKKIQQYAIARDGSTNKEIENMKQELKELTTAVIRRYDAEIKDALKGYEYAVKNNIKLFSDLGSAEKPFGFAHGMEMSVYGKYQDPHLMFKNIEISLNKKDEIKVRELRMLWLDSVEHTSLPIDPSIQDELTKRINELKEFDEEFPKFYEEFNKAIEYTTNKLTNKEFEEK